jgi:hypothetical protein
MNSSVMKDSVSELAQCSGELYFISYPTVTGTDSAELADQLSISSKDLLIKSSEEMHTKLLFHEGRELVVF